MPSRDRAPAGPVLVLGATGLVGSRLCAALRAGLGAAGVLAASRRGDPGQGVDALSLSDGAETTRYVRDRGPAVVVWCVRAGAGRPGAATEPVLAEVGLSAVCAALVPSARLVYVSSDSVLAGAHGPHDESAPVEALPTESPYAAYVEGKIAGERIAASLGERCAIVRCGPIFGRGACGRWDARTTALQAAWGRGEAPGRPVNVLRSWIAVGDLARALALLVGRPAPGLWHVGPAEGASLYDHALWAARLLAPPGARVAPTHVTPSEARRRHVRLDLRLDARRATRAFGFTPAGVADGLGRER